MISWNTNTTMIGQTTSLYDMLEYDYNWPYDHMTLNWLRSDYDWLRSNYDWLRKDFDWLQYDYDWL